MSRTKLLEEIVNALCKSEYRWRLPVNVDKGFIRQFQPADFGRDPASTKKAGDSSPQKDKDSGQLYYTGARCGSAMADFKQLLEQRIAKPPRSLYRPESPTSAALESLTHIRLLGNESELSPNCILDFDQTMASIPVLIPRDDATLEQVLATTDDKEVKGKMIRREAESPLRNFPNLLRQSNNF